ncbi:hypothetical protein DFP72DRAFT_758222, partial [Ephemerocybe angulata]
NPIGKAKWARLRALLPQITHEAGAQSPLNTPSAPGFAVSPAVNVVDELITGGLATLMPKLWFDRAEKGQRRIPVLLHRLRLRITDSLHPLHKSRSVFRIECEYANGAARWVVYRELRDFVSLHSHYTISQASHGAHHGHGREKLPDFPATSIPYFKFLNKESGSKIGKAEFARLQREQLENYLIGLIRVVMFHPTSNRLATFLEISSLSIALSHSGGAQYKAGYLRVEAESRGATPFGRKSSSHSQRREQRWCAVRESYLVALVEPGELDIWDVFLLDSEFKIERPKRYYRQGFGGLLHLDGSSDEENEETVDRLEANGDKSKEEEEEQRKALAEVRDHQRNLREQQKKAEGKDVSKHTFYIVNSQMRLKLYARNERQMLQFITAFERVAQNSPYTGKNRFDSFAPIRMNVAAQWLVDGRDYFWNLSRAILMAKESIYIHDWWLSPELLMRRPGKDHYRLDRLLERKAKEGVKIYIIIYLEVSNRTTPTDSSYTKQRLASLHPNVMVQRSPSHFQTGTFYWAHHEKLCVIDQTIAFMGGLDACFGSISIVYTRWDTPQHALTDDTLDTDQPEIWPGKDYSNPRVSDFHTLNKPEEDMYDRTKVPRMPWHDVAMQIVGQPARDLARHFVQRWNYLLRIKNHSRIMPFLLPPPEFRPGELSQMGLTGTCELQIVRSCGPWSMGTPGKVEHSIQNAYLKSIQMSEHFVYIENQFFITSTVVEEVKIENKIGDALVQRIIRAHHDKTPWKCCIVIPLLPGFTFGVDHSDASAIRIILECQNRTICRGPDSIFSRLRKEGIDPDEYISVYSLRNWAKMRDDVLVTEQASGWSNTVSVRPFADTRMQVYIHAKICIVDDRLAIIGSANINERSQRGERDSELAAVIRDTDLIDCTMAGKPFKVGRFAHSLRVRLMREHLGIDVDALVEDDLMSRDPMKAEYDQQPWDPNSEQTQGKEGGFTEIGSQGNSAPAANLAHFVRMGALRQPGPTAEATEEGLQAERRDYNAQGKQEEGFASSAVPTMEEKTVMEDRPRKENVATGYDTRVSSDEPGEHSHHSSERPGDGAVYGAPANAGPDDGLPRLSVDLDNDQQRAGPEARSLLRKHMSFNQWGVPTSRPNIHPDDFEDPICDEFWKEKWVASAAHNTEIYRKVFHAVPDDLITTWKQYTEFVAYHDRMAKPVGSSPESNLGHEFQDGTSTEFSRDSHEPSVDANHGPSFDARQSRKPTKGTEPFERWEREEMERLLNDLNGHLVIYPTRFLEGEDIANNFLFNADRLLPLPIY